MAPSLDEHLAVSILAGDKYYFKSTGRRNLFAGFTAVLSEAKTKEELDEESPEYGELPGLGENETLRLLELLGYQHFTKPPARFNDASLVKALEEKGIGRPSTYAPTLHTLLSRDYVQRKGGALSPSELGETVVDLLVKFFPQVLDVGFTAQLEEELDRIEEGDVDWVQVLKNFHSPFEQDVAQAREQMQDMRQEAVVTEQPCEQCGKPLVMRRGRFGKFLACSGFPECKFTRSLPTGFFCPLPGCGGELVKKVSRAGRPFYGCSKYPACNYITNKLPKKDETEESQKPAQLEVLGP
jgi:DNA topoisomerase-1